MKKWLLFGLPILILVALIGWRFMGKAQQQASLAQQSGARRGAAPSVEFAVAKSGTIDDAIQAVGTAESPFRIEIAPKFTGRIESLDVREGDRVTKGQVLVRLDPTELEGLVAQQTANVAEARSRLAQAQLIQGPTEVGVEGQVEQQKANVASVEADLDQVERNLELVIANAQSSVVDAQSKVASAKSQVGNAKSQLSLQRANLENAQAKLTRAEGLFAKGYVSQQVVDDARTSLEVQTRVVEVADGQVSSAESSLASAEALLATAKNQEQIARRKAQSDITAAKARVVQAETSLKLAGANRAQTPAFKENLAALRSSVQAAEAQLNQAKSRLADTVLRSPIDGTVTNRTADPGATSTPGSPILVVQSLNWLYVTSSLPLEESGRVKLGQEAMIVFDALPKQEFRGKVTHISPAADVQSRQFGIRVTVQNPGELIKPGMFGRVLIVIGQTDAKVVVPREAIKTTDGKSTVTVVDEKGVAKVLPVKTGATSGDTVEILSGIKPGDKVVTLSYQPVKDGQTVKSPEPKGKP